MIDKGIPATFKGGDSTWPFQFTLPDIIGKSPKIMQAKKLALQAAKGGIVGAASGR